MLRDSRAAASPASETQAPLPEIEEAYLMDRPSLKTWVVVDGAPRAPTHEVRSERIFDGN